MPVELEGPVAAMEAGDYVAAAEELRGIVSQDSSNVQALRLLGSAYMHLGVPLQAIQVCRAVATVDSTDAGIKTVLGFLYFQQGAFEEAELYYRQAIIKDPRQVQAYQGLGWIYLQRHQLQEALDMVTRTTEQAPNYAPNYVLMGRVLTGQGFFENAKNAYQRAFVLDPKLRDRYGILLQELVLRHRLIR
ncbi:MAG: tetratricopeptide repeat protein [bacterium]|nr:tetratricopeptide repeat protein [bacterium]